MRRGAIKKPPDAADDREHLERLLDWMESSNGEIEKAMQDWDTGRSNP